MNLAGFLITIGGTIGTIIGLVYSRSAAQGVDKLRRDLVARVHYVDVIGKLKVHRRNISTMLSARQGGLVLDAEIAEVGAHLEDLRGLLSPYGKEIDEIIHVVRNPKDDSLGRGHELVLRLARVLALADNAVNKQTLANTGV